MKNIITYTLGICIGFILGYIFYPKQSVKNDETQIVNKELTPEQILAGYDCVIRNSNNPDTILLYKQKKELLLFELSNQNN